MQPVLHTVVNGHPSAANLHLVNLAGVDIVIVGIAFSHRQQNWIFASQTEHRVTKCIGYRIGILIDQWHGRRFASCGLSLIGTVAEVIECIVSHLAVCDFHGCMVNAVVAIIIVFLGLIDALAINISESTLVGRVASS